MTPTPTRLIAALAMASALSCGGDGVTEPTFTMADLVGTWTGSVENSQNSLSISVTCDAEGNVSGSGVSSSWTIDSEGRVTGSGSFAFISGSSLTVAGTSWSLQLGKDRRTLTGRFDVSYPTLHDMAVELRKQ